MANKAIQPNRKLTSKYLGTMSSDQIKEITLKDHAGLFQYVNLSFPFKGKHIKLTLKPDTSTLLKPHFVIKVFDINGTNTSFKRTSDNCFIGNVEGDVRQGANALLVRGLWFISFEGASGTMYNIEPDLKYSSSERITPSAAIYQITEIHKDEIRGARQHRLNNRWPSLHANLRRKRIVTTDHHVAIGTHLKLESRKQAVNTSIASTQTKPYNLRSKMHNESVQPKLASATYHHLIQQNNRLSNDKRQMLKTAVNKLSCNVLAITDKESWERFGIEDPITVASFLSFAFRQANRMLSLDQSMYNQAVKLKIEDIYVYDEFPDDPFKSRCENTLRVSSDRTCVNVSALLCSLWSNQDNKAYCMVQVITAYDLGELFGTTVIPDKGYKEPPDYRSDADMQASERPVNTPMSENFEGEPGIQSQSRSIGVTSLLGCRQMLSIGVRII